MGKALELAKGQPFAELNGANDFSAMPSVGGDPVVESGSNSDGEWFRSADGIQMCSIKRKGPDSRNEQRIQYNWVLPQAFVDQQYSTTGNGDLNSIFAAGWELSGSTSLYPVTTEVFSASEARLYLHTNYSGVATNWSSVNVNGHAIGRWK